MMHESPMKSEQVSLKLPLRHVDCHVAVGWISTGVKDLAKQHEGRLTIFRLSLMALGRHQMEQDEMVPS